VLIFYAAELVGAAGIAAFKKGLPALVEGRGVDFVIAAADGATHGGGLGFNHAAYIHKLGADVINLGDFSFYKKDLTQNIDKLRYVLRPFNLVSGAPGRGAAVFKTRDGRKLAVVLALGQVGFSKLHAEHPYEALPPLLKKLKAETPHIIVDFHALATAEKKTLGALDDGQCSAVIGSHTRVQSADERVLAGGTAYISDAGRTGSRDSVGGLVPDVVIGQYLSGIPAWSREADAAPCLQGVLLELSEDGRAVSIERVSVLA
jgi:metallophosphoesterase (TIGR00282 family)